jgi:hypothetical protein
LLASDQRAIRERIEVLLGKSIDLDQAVIFESEAFSGERSKECARILETISQQAMASAQKIREVRNLILELA